MNGKLWKRNDKEIKIIIEEVNKEDKLINKIYNLLAKEKKIEIKVEK